MKSSANEGTGDRRPGQSVRPGGGPLTALLVESDKAFIKKLTSLIRHSQVLDDAKAMRLEPVPAFSLKEAVFLLQQGRFDVILTDINLSDASGFLILEQLLHHGKGAPIVILSNITNWAVLLQAAQAGISDFLVKKTLEAGILMRAIFYAIERKKLENKIKETEALYRSLVNVLPLGLVRVDVDGALTYVNDIFSKMVHLTHQDMLGRKIETCFEHADFNKVQLGILETLKTGQHFESEFVMKSKDRLEKHLHLIATPIHGNQESITGAQCVLIDVTAQKQVQHEMEATKALDALQSGVSHLAHALNNALTPLLLDALNLKRKLGTLLPGDPVRRIEDSVEKARSVLRPFLFSTHGVGPRSEMLDFCSVLKTVVMQFRNNLSPGVRVECQGFDQSCSVLGDASMLSKMLTHVLQNALESMPAGGRLKIHLQAVDHQVTAPRPELVELPPGRYLWLSVVDHGEGIESDQLQRVFEPFQTTKLPPHAGVGLTEALVIIKGHQGNIRLESEVGQGTKVHVYLPLCSKDLKSSFSPDRLVPSIHSSKSKTILLVDDEENILESVQMLIHHMGHHVLTASNGAEGLHLFRKYQEQVDLVITDYEMPLINGATLIRHLREMAPSANVILFTGLESKERVDELNKLKVDSILYKPFTPESLQRQIEQLL